MDTELTPEEKKLIEREFVAQEDAHAKTRATLKRICWVGVTAYLLSIFVPRTEFGWLVILSLRFVWVCCAGLYTVGHVFPGTFSKDIDPFWHANPWQDALQNLSEDGRQFEALALLAVPILGRILSGLMAAAHR